MNKSKIANSCQLKNFESRLVDQVLDFTIKDSKISKNKILMKAFEGMRDKFND